MSMTVAGPGRRPPVPPTPKEAQQAAGAPSAPDHPTLSQLRASEEQKRFTATVQQSTYTGKGSVFDTMI